MPAGQHAARVVQRFLGGGEGRRGGFALNASHVAARESREQCHPRDVGRAAANSELLRGGQHEHAARQLGELLPGDPGPQQPLRDGPEPSTAGGQDRSFGLIRHMWDALSHIWSLIASGSGAGCRTRKAIRDGQAGFSGVWTALCPATASPRTSSSAVAVPGPAAARVQRRGCPPCAAASRSPG